MNRIEIQVLVRKQFYLPINERVHVDTLINIMHDLPLKLVGLIICLMGAVIICFSFGINFEDGYQVKKGKKVYRSSFLYPIMFYCGVVLLGVGIILQLV